MGFAGFGGAKPAGKKKSGFAGFGGSSGTPVITEDTPGLGTNILETAKGAGRSIIDVIARTNYAAAGAAEELLTQRGGGAGAALKRVGQELFSGIGGLKGQKEGFAQVMEQSGVGELGKLSNVLPFLYNDTGEGARFQRGGWADPTGRGAIGLGADILTDPTTYLTAGGAITRRVLTGTGTKYLSKEGMVALKNIEEVLEPAYKAARSETDDVARIAARKTVNEQRSKLLDAAIAKDPALLDKTGVKWFGQEVISKESLDKISDTAKKVVLAVPGGDLAARGAAKLSDGLHRAFDPYADLRGLPEDVRDGMKGLLRENSSAAAMHKTAMYSEWSQLEKEYRGLSKSYGRGEVGRQELGKKFAAWREQTGTPSLTKAEQDLFLKLGAVYDRSEALALREGLISPEQAAKHSGKYLHHEYKNPEVLSETAKSAGRPLGAPTVTEQFQRERPFATYDEAVRISKDLNAEGKAYREAGGASKLYGELQPEYDAMKNMASYIEQLTDGTWRKRTVQEARDLFGLQLDDVMDPSKVYSTPSTVLSKADREAVDGVLETLELPREKGIKRYEVTEAATREARATLPRLSKDGQKALASEMVAKARSAGDVLRIREAVGEANMPLTRVTKPGDIEPFFQKYGMPGQLVSRSGGLWGDKEILIPEAIAKMVENAPRDIVMDGASRAKLQGLVRAYDKYTNLFKAATYPFYPSGAVRDTYNNVMQAFLGLGVGAFARPFQAAKVLRGADDVIRVGARDYTARELKTLAKDLGVIDPTARSFVQFTGEKGAEKASALTKARAVRGSVDNATRTQMFLNNLHAGATPENAAQMVKDFLFDYTELSAFDRDVMRRLIPFYVFPRKVVGNTAQVLKTTPGRLANLAKPFRGREDENNALTTWEGEGFKLRMDRDGKTLTMLNGVDLPIRSMDILWKGDPVRTMEGWLSMASPAIKVPYELASGRDPFRGQEFGRTQAHALGPVIDKLPKAIQVWAGFKRERDAVGRPKYTYRQDRIQVLAEAMLVSRILSTSDRAFREQARDPNVAARLLDVMTGFRFKTLNLDEEEKRSVEMKQHILEEEAVKQGLLDKFEKIYKRKPKNNLSF